MLGHRCAFLSGGEKLDEIQELLDANMKAVMGPVVAKQISTQLALQFGRFEAVGEARFQDELLGYRRFGVGHSPGGNLAPRIAQGAQVAEKVIEAVAGWVLRGACPEAG